MLRELEEILVSAATASADAPNRAVTWQFPFKREVYIYIYIYCTKCIYTHTLFKLFLDSAVLVGFFYLSRFWALNRLSWVVVGFE